MSRFFFQNWDREVRLGLSKNRGMLPKWTGRKISRALNSGVGKKGLEIRPTKEISCRFMCFIRLSRQETSLKLHFSFTLLRSDTIVLSVPASIWVGVRGVTAIASFAIRFHGSDAFEDSMACLSVPFLTEPSFSLDEPNVSLPSPVPPSRLLTSKKKESDRNGPVVGRRYELNLISLLWKNVQNFSISETKSQVIELLDSRFFSMKWVEFCL